MAKKILPEYEGTIFEKTLDACFDRAYVAGKEGDYYFVTVDDNGRYIDLGIHAKDVDTLKDRMNEVFSSGKKMRLFLVFRDSETSAFQYAFCEAIPTITDFGVELSGVDIRNVEALQYEIFNNYFVGVRLTNNILYTCLNAVNVANVLIGDCAEFKKALGSETAKYLGDPAAFKERFASFREDSKYNQTLLRGLVKEMDESEQNLRSAKGAIKKQKQNFYKFAKIKKIPTENLEAINGNFSKVDKCLDICDEFLKDKRQECRELVDKALREYKQAEGLYNEKLNLVCENQMHTG